MNTITTRIDHACAEAEVGRSVQLDLTEQMLGRSLDDSRVYSDVRDAVNKGLRKTHRADLFPAPSRRPGGVAIVAVVYRFTE